MKGFRVPAQASKKDAMRKMETELQNTQMAVRISQMMLQQIMDNMKTMSNDLSSSLSQIMGLQYTVTALRKYLNVDDAGLEAIANEQRLKDFNEGSAAADLKENLVTSDVVEANSTITLTSTSLDANGADKGIFRSRISLSEKGIPENLVKELLGKTVGSVVTVNLNGTDHNVTVLTIRNPSKEVTAAETTEAAATNVEVSH